MKGNFMKRLLCMILIAAMFVVNAEPAFAAEDSKVTFEQVDNDRVSATLSDRESTSFIL